MVRLIGVAGTHTCRIGGVGWLGEASATGGIMGSGQERDSGDASKLGEASELDEAGADALPGEAGADALSEGDDADFDAMDTTSWSGSAPPVLIEDEEETIVSLPALQPEAVGADDPDPEVGTATAPEFEPEVADEPDAELDVDVEVDPDRATLPPGASPDALNLDATLLATPEPEPELGSVDVAAAASVAMAGAGAARLDEAETIIAQTTEDVTTPRSIAPSSSLPPLLLERIDPSMGRGERIRLDVRHWHVRLGRAEENEIRLYTASASRVHALIAGNEEGQWILSPGEGKTVFVDGEAVSEPVELEAGMNLVLGKDHLRCVTPSSDRGEGTVRTATEAFEGGASDWPAKLRAAGPLAWAALVLVACLFVAIVIWWGA